MAGTLTVATATPRARKANAERRVDKAPPAVKRCAKCQETLPGEAFNKDNGSRDGLLAWCRECCRVRNAERRAAPGQREKAREDQYRWRAANVAHFLAYRRRYCEENPEERRRKTREWNKANPDKVRARDSRRRARKAGATIGAPVIRSKIAERDGYRCYLCGAAVDMSLTYPDKQSAVREHVIALALGGSHCPENVRLAHNACNAMKSDSPIALCNVRTLGLAAGEVMMSYNELAS